MRLDQIIPVQVTYKIMIDGVERELRIGPFTSRHEIWLKQTFGDGIEKIFKEIDGPSLARIAFHVMHPDDRVHFTKKVYETIDEEGNSLTETIGGYQLLASCVKGPAEKLRLLEALTQSIGVSRSMLDELEAEEKKKALANP
jgi:hypothetical protein